METVQSNLLSPAGLEIFGKRRIVAPSAQQSGLFNGIHFPALMAGERLRCICRDVLAGKSCSINQLLVDRLVQAAIADSDEFTRMLIDVFCEGATDLANRVQAHLDNGSFSLAEFLVMYQTYYNRCTVLQYALGHADRCTEVESGARMQRSFITLVKNVALYMNFISRIYCLDAQELHLFDVCSRYILPATPPSDVLAVFRIYQFYEYLTGPCVPRVEDRSLYFGDSGMRFSLAGTKTELVVLQAVVSRVDELTKILSREKVKTTVDELTGEIRGLLQLGTSIGDKAQFAMIYRHALTSRLLRHQSSPELEESLLKMFFNLKDDPMLYTKMRHQIADAIAGQQFYAACCDSNISFRTERFVRFKVDELHRRDCNFLVTNNYMWDLSTSEPLTVSDEIAIYIAIYDKYFSMIFKDKELSYQYEMSTGVLRMLLANREEYFIQMTIPQMCAVLEVTRAGQISAQNLGTCLDMPLARLGPVLNSLIDAGLLVRSTGAPNDPLIMLSVNWDKSFPSPKVSITNLVKQFTNEAPKVCGINATVLRAKIFGALVGTDGLPFSEIVTALQNLGLSVSSAQIMEELSRAITNGTVVMDDDRYLYVKRAILDDE